MKVWIFNIDGSIELGTVIAFSTSKKYAQIDTDYGVKHVYHEDFLHITAKNYKTWKTTMLGDRYYQTLTVKGAA